jgi:hypothetical protein
MRKNGSKIVAQVLKWHHAQNGSNDTVGGRENSVVEPETLDDITLYN